MITDVILTPGEKVSSAFLKTMRIVEQELEKARLGLEATKDFDQTQVIRGRIKAFRWVLSLVEDRPLTVD